MDYSFHREIVDEFMQHCSNEWNDVIMICGNHEHYNHIFRNTYKVLKDRYGHIQNLHILDNETVTLGDITFVGGTMWSDFNNGDPLTLLTIRSLMNDFKLIRNSSITEMKNDFHGFEVLTQDLFTPEIAWGEFLKFYNFLNKATKDTSKKYCVVTHHAPSYKSIHPKYKNDYTINGGYCSDLDDFIENSPEIKVMIHGHIHFPQDYMIGETRVVCNPRGYVNHEVCSTNFILKVVEV